MTCELYPSCSATGCGRVACDHANPEPHVLHDNVTWCDGYEFPPGMTSSDFQGGGGSSGGGGATIRW